MSVRSTTTVLAVLAASTLALPARGETIYFKNKRTIEASGYEVKGPLIYVTMQSGKTVYLRADSVDWEGTERLKQAGVILLVTDYASVDDLGGEMEGMPSRTLTASDLRKTTSFRLRRSGAASLVVEVPATQSWVDSRINVQAGRPVTLRASGSVTVAPGVDTGPAGTPGGEGRPLLASAPLGALLARIGLAGQAVLVGASGEIVPTTSGRLFLTVNDTSHEDNAGRFTVRVDQRGTAQATPSWSGSAETASAPAGGGAAGSPAPAKGFVGAVDRARSTREAVTGR